MATISVWVEANDANDGLRDHEFFICADDANGNCACRGRYDICIDCVLCLDKRHAEKFKFCTHAYPEYRRVLADAASEHQRIDVAQRRSKRADPFLYLIAKHHHRFGARTSRVSHFSRLRVSKLVSNRPTAAV